MPSLTPEPENEHEALRLFRERLETIVQQHPDVMTPEHRDRLPDYLTAEQQKENDDASEE